MPHKRNPGDVLFHATHGLCRVKEIVKQDHMEKGALYYTIEPAVPNRMKARYIIPVEEIRNSGFHDLVSAAEAQTIMNFFSRGDVAAPPDGTSVSETWSFARTLYDHSSEGADVRGQKIRQTIDRAARGLVRELATALKMPAPEVAAKILKKLNSPYRANSVVVSALSRIEEE